MKEAGATVYLRPETAQGIFLDFKTVLGFARRKPPFGIAQVGKSFRNEITPGNFIFRTLEFEQMEMEFFVPPDEAQQWHEHWLKERMAKTIPLDAPWTAPKAKEWDSQTFETWKLANVLTPSGRFLLDVAITSVFSCEPRDVSLLFVLFYLAAAGNESNPGNIERLVNTGGGAQERRFVGGSQLVPIKLAERLGDRVVLGQPVRRIVSDSGTVTAVADGRSVTAQRAIVAIPPPLAARIDYSPQLPALRDQLTQRMPMGTVMKVHAVYPEPFWRAAGLTGQAVADTPPAQATFDNTPPSGRPGILMPAWSVSL